MPGGEAHLVGTYQKPDGSIDIEGSKHYTIVPLSNSFSNNPSVDVTWSLTTPPFYFIKQGGKLINDATGMPVGNAFTESMPIEKLKNRYEANQH